MPINTIQFKSQQPNPNLPQVIDVSADEVNTLKGQLRLIDVRRPDEWVGELGHIAEAELITLDTLPMRLSEISQDEHVVFVCRSGARSAQAAAFALENGYRTVYNMRGGMIDWNNKNFATQDKNK